MSEQTSDDSGMVIPPEVPEADRLEQSRDDDEQAVGRDVPRAGFTVEEASEADILEQSEEVPFDDDSYR
jgi:hypothetical protein